MEVVILALLMLTAVLISGIVGRLLPLSIPLPLVQIGLGFLISGVFQHGVVLDPEVFFVLFLPPLLFLDGWRIPKQGLLRDKFSILNLAFGLVFFTVIGVGYLIHWMIPAMPLPIAFALAAIISPTDPVAVSAITRRVPVPRRLLLVLEGESLFNDASGLVAFRFAVAAAVTGMFSLESATVSFLWVATGGVLMGTLSTLALIVIRHGFTRRFGEEPGSEILLSLLTPFVAYFLAEHFQASGILAAVAAGVTMSYAEMHGSSLPVTRVQRKDFWDTVQFALNGSMFVLLGEQLPKLLQGAVDVVQSTGHHNPWWLLVYTTAIFVALAVLRFVWVWISLQLAYRISQRQGHTPVKVTTRLMAVLSLAGVRGAVTLAGVLTLPLVMQDGSPLPARDLAIFLAAAVIIASLVAASIGLPRLLKGIAPMAETRTRRQRQLIARVAERAARRSVHRALKEAAAQQADDSPHASLYTHVARRVLDSLEASIRGVEDTEQVELRDQARRIERQLRIMALQASRQAVYRLGRTHRVSDNLVRAHVRQLDLEEASLSDN